ncbi:hypothetical protein KR093_001058, partial [Drosophila rubida]
MRMINWHSLVFFLPGFLAHAWPNSTRSELFVRATHDHSALAMSSLETESCWPDSCCWRWLIELQSSECPFMQLLVHCLLALPIYNLLMILIGWHLHKSTSGIAERVILLVEPEVQRPLALQSLQPLAMLPSPPSPPPRCKRRRAPKPPTRRLRAILCSPDKYPSHKDPFATAPSYEAPQADRYRTLRLNLLRVLEGLQQPPPPPMLALPLPMPVPKPEPHPFDMLDEPALTESTVSSGLPKSKRKPSKWLNAVVKRLGQRFAKSKSRKQCEDYADATISHRSSSGSSRSTSS